MIGMIRHLVQAPEREVRPVLRAWGSFAAGSALGALAISVPAAALAGAVDPPAPAAFGALLAAAALLVCFDVGILPGGPPTLRRQTKRAWFDSFGPWSWLFWGVDLGLGVTTLRVGSVYWMVWAASVLILPASVVPLVFLGYAAGLTAGLVAATRALGARPRDSGSRLLALAGAARSASALVVALGAPLLVAVGLAGGLLR